MWFTALLRRPKTRRSSGRQGEPTVLRLEALEDRTLPSTLTVTSALNNGAGSLRDAISKAKDGDTIVFAPSLNGQTITLSDELTLNNSLDIEGPGPGLLALSGNDTNRIFGINEGLTVTVNGLTLTHGRAGSSTYGGGAIFSIGSVLSLANDVFSSNVAVTATGLPSGGAIATYGSGLLTVTDSTFVGNRADARAKGGIFATGGAIYGGPATGSHPNGPSMTIIRCTFLNNQALGADGGVLGFSAFHIGAAVGGALVVKETSTLTVLDSTFVGNQAIGGSGGSAPSGNSQGFYAVDTGDGGAIESVQGATLVVSGSTFAYNLAQGGSNATGATTPGGLLGSAAGGAVESEGPATITNCTFDHNQALGGSGNTGSGALLVVGTGDGGAIAEEQFGPNFVASLTVSNSTFTNNQAVGGAGNTGGFRPGGGWGGGISTVSVGPLGVTATVTGSTFTGNQAIGGAGGAGGNGADGLGGALASLLGSTLTVSGSTFSGNQAIGGAGGPGGNGGNGLGGGVYNDGTSTLTVTASTVTANQATGGAAGSGGSAGQGIGGGAFFATGGTVWLDLFTSLNIDGNAASTSNNDVFGLFTICL
jgi:hypothetical protein